MRRAVVVVSLCAALVTSCAKSEAPRPEHLSKIDPVTPSQFTKLVRTMAGKPLVVNFWATWCDPCKEEMPLFAKAAKRYAESVRFLGVDVQDDPTLAARFARKLGIAYRSVGDPRKDVAVAQGLFGLPATQFYTAGGRLDYLHRGPIESRELTRRIDSLLD